MDASIASQDLYLNEIHIEPSNESILLDPQEMLVEHELYWKPNMLWQVEQVTVALASHSCTNLKQWSMNHEWGIQQGFFQRNTHDVQFT